ncbi:MAG: hypothetical protein HY791_00490 [Deltaproteobacteria bacterium]|nr:hypothetical protein [Deltaproteobacteria bacterium]
MIALLLISAGLGVEAKLDAKQPIVVGAPFGVVVEASHAKGEIALLPEKLELGESLAERPSARKHERAQREGSEVDVYRLELLALDSGSIEVPAIPVAVGSTTAESRPFQIQVGSSLKPDEQLVAGSTRPEALEELERMSAANPSPMAILVRDYKLLYVLLGLAVVGAIAYLVARRKRRKAESPSVLPGEPPRPAHEVALERLEALSASSFLSRGELKPFFVELSEILRIYVGARYGFESVELTVRELVDELNARGAEGLDVDGLRRLLDQADLVKFAKWETTKDEARSLLAVGVGLVKRSGLREEAP